MTKLYGSIKKENVIVCLLSIEINMSDLVCQAQVDKQHLEVSCVNDLRL